MVALLQALAEMGEDEADARLLGLSRVAEGTLYAATWPTAPETVRTLTNSDGEQAMPLFSGLETLETAARRFGWSNPDGSLCFRELAAREAMQSAVTQKVNFVVLDIHAEYSTEFTREEVSRVLREARPMRAAAPARPMPPRVMERAANVLDRPTRESIKPGLSQRPRSMSSKLAAAVVKKGQGGIAEIDQPFAERGTGKVAAPPRAAGAPAREASRASAASRRDKRVDSKPLRADSKPLGAHARKESRQAMPVAHRARSARPAPHAEVKAKATPAAAAKPRAATPRTFRMPPADPPTEPLDFVPIIDTHDPVAAPAEPVAPPPEVQEIEALPVLEELPLQVEAPAPAQEPAAGPRGFAADAHPSLPLLEDVALPDLPSIPASNAPLPMAAPEPAVRNEPAPSAAGMPAAKPAAGPKPAAVAAPEPAREKRVARAAAAPEPQPEAEPPAAEAAGPAGAQPGLRAPVTPLDTAVLDAIAQALRKFPEVEWAAEVADEHDAAVIAVRVDPSFQTRVADIEAAVLAAGERARASFTFLLLRNPQHVKEARSQGGTFFPWRKRTPAKK